MHRYMHDTYTRCCSKISALKFSFRAAQSSWDSDRLHNISFDLCDLISLTSDLSWFCMEATGKVTFAKKQTLRSYVSRMSVTQHYYLKFFKLGNISHTGHEVTVY